jgi:NAD(P)H-nitrite reductase large subunit
MKRVVIIGASAAGASAAEAVRRLDQECRVTLVSDEPVPLYSRCLLSDYLLGQVSRGRLTFQPPDWPRGLNVEVIQEPAVELNLATGQVVTASGRRVPYDRLVVATGASPLLPPVYGLETDGVFTLYRLDQVDAALAALARARQVVVLGASKVGVKAAEAVAARGIAVTLVEQASHVLPGTLDSKSAAWVEELLTDRGVQVETDATVVELVPHDGQVAEVGLDSGQRLSCDLFLIAIGTRPNADLAREAGIQVRQGILVDAHMQTSAEGVYAAGDVAEAPVSPSERPGGVLSGSTELAEVLSKGWVANWMNAVQQGRVAGRNLAGEKVLYAGSVRANAFRLVGLPIISVGEVDGAGGDCFASLAMTSRAQVYRRLVFRDGRLIGTIQVGGDVTDVGILSSLIKSGADVEGLQESLFADGFALFASQRGRQLLAERLYRNSGD